MVSDFICNSFRRRYNIRMTNSTIKRDAEAEARYRELLAWLPKGAHLLTLEEVTASGVIGVLDTKQFEPSSATYPQPTAHATPAPRPS